MGNHKSFVKGIAFGAVIVVFAQSLYSFALQGSFPLFSTGDLSREKKTAEIIRLLEDFYVDDIAEADLWEGMYTGLVYGVGDKYTTYMDEKSYRLFEEDTMGEFAGIGAYFTIDEKDGQITVVSPIEGSPALAAGILPGDKIVKVNGFDVSGDSYDDAVAMIKGPEGTSVSLTIYRDDPTDTTTMDIVRANINVPTVSCRLLEEDIGYIKISQFAANTYEQFVEACNLLGSQGAGSLIIDLRNNPGGILQTVVQIADLLLPEGTIVYTVDKNGKRIDEVSGPEYIDLPLVLLINGRSASASEVLAGAVRDYEKGILVGETSFGKGLVQRIFPMSDGSAVKITIQRYYTPNGISIHGVGIEPDYFVELPEEEAQKLLQNTLLPEEDMQLLMAVEVLNNLMTE